MFNRFDNLLKLDVNQFKSADLVVDF